MVLVSPDGERSMNTYLGVSEFLAPEDIDEAAMAAAEWIFLEGYRYDGPDSIAAFEKAVRATKRAGGKVAITLSDPFCVERHRDEFLRMIRADVDLLVANEHELMSLYQTGDLGVAMDRAQAEVPVTACTVGAEGGACPRRRDAGARAGDGGDGGRRHRARGISSPRVPARPGQRAGLADLRADGVSRGRGGDRPCRGAARGGPATAVRRRGAELSAAAPDPACIPAAPRGDNPRLGIALMIATAFVFACQDGMSRYLASNYSVITVVMIRYWFFALFVVTLASAQKGGVRRVAATARPVTQVVRGVLLVVEICVTVLSYVLLGLIGTHAIFSVYPLLVAALAGPVLGEYVGWRRGLAIAMGLAGVLVILRPGFQVFSPVALVPLAGALLFAVYALLTRQVGRTDSSETSLFYTGVVGAVAITARRRRSSGRRSTAPSTGSGC